MLEFGKLLAQARTMKAGEKYRLVCLEEDIIDSGIADSGSELFEEILNRSGAVVTLRQNDNHQWSTQEITNKDGTFHWYFNADCFVPLDAL